MNIEEKMPVKTPKNMTSAKGRITSPPKIASVIIVARAVPWVSTVRGKRLVDGPIEGGAKIG